jgi:bifunctional non-homologous end joining protein LigD
MAFRHCPQDGRTGEALQRPGNDLIVETLARLRSRSCIIDGEAVACDDDGITSFNRVRYRRHDESIFLYAFDLIELNGDDLRREPLEGRKATLEMILAKAGIGIRFNEHMKGDGGTVFRHLCKLGLEGIVSKRKDSAYRSGRSPDWVKMKNADAPAVKREADEDWGKERQDLVAGVEAMTDSPKRTTKRSITIKGHKTSVSLEKEFWDCLTEIAVERGVSVGALVAAIDANRQHAHLSSAIRIFVLRFYRYQLRR